MIHSCIWKLVKITFLGMFFFILNPNLAGPVLMFYLTKYILLLVVTKIKLDGVGLVDNRPSTAWLHHFVQKKKKKKMVTLHT